MWFCGSTNTSIRGPWWVGDTRVTTPCQYGERASFTTWPSAEVGNVIQRPASASSSPFAAAKTVSQTITSRTSPPFAIVNATQITSPTGRAFVTVTNQPNDSSESRDRQSLALGTGLGIPLGIACVAFLAFLLWTIRQRKGESIRYEKSVKAQELDRGENHSQPPGEMSSGETGQEMWAESPRQFTEIDSRQNYELNAH